MSFFSPHTFLDFFWIDFFLCNLFFFKFYFIFKLYIIVLVQSIFSPLSVGLGIIYFFLFF